MYGPLTEQVTQAITMVEALDADRLEEIATAYKVHGNPKARFCIAAARRADRWNEVFEAGKDMAVSVTALALVHDWNPAWTEAATSAAWNAGVALATEDLIGSMGYTSDEYARLVDPWFAGFPME